MNTHQGQQPAKEMSDRKRSKRASSVERNKVISTQHRQQLRHGVEESGTAKPDRMVEPGLPSKAQVSERVDDVYESVLVSKLAREVEKKQRTAQDRLDEIQTRLNEVLLNMLSPDKREHSAPLEEETATVGQKLVKELNDARVAINFVKDKKLRFVLTKFLGDYKNILSLSREPERKKIMKDLDAYFALATDSTKQPLLSEDEVMLESRAKVRQALAEMSTKKTELITASQNIIMDSLPDDTSSDSSLSDAWSEVKQILTNPEFRQLAGTYAELLETKLKVFMEHKRRRASRGISGIALGNRRVSSKASRNLHSKSDVSASLGGLTALRQALAEDIRALQVKEADISKSMKKKEAAVTALSTEVKKVTGQSSKLMGVASSTAQGVSLQLKEKISATIKAMGAIVDAAHGLVGKRETAVGAVPPDVKIAHDLTSSKNFKDESMDKQFKKAVDYLARGHTEIVRAVTAITSHTSQVLELDQAILELERKMHAMELLAVAAPSEGST